MVSGGREAKSYASLITLLFIASGLVQQYLHLQSTLALCLSGVSSTSHFHKISKPLQKIEFKLNSRKTSSEFLKLLRFHKQELTLGDAPQHFRPPGRGSGKQLGRSEECRYRESNLSDFTSV